MERGGQRGYILFLRRAQSLLTVLHTISKGFVEVFTYRCIHEGTEESMAEYTNVPLGTTVLIKQRQNANKNLPSAFGH